MTQTNLTVPSVVLVHAAWADASSWNKVIQHRALKRWDTKHVQGISLCTLADKSIALWVWVLIVIVVVSVIFLWFAAKRNSNPMASPKNAPLHQPK